MAKLSEVLDVGQIALDIPAEDVTACLQAMARLLVTQGRLTAQQGQALAEALMRREALGRTAIGGGVAVPHAYLDAVARPMLLIGRLRRHIAYDAPDELPVDLVFLLAGPASAEKEHLQTLARIVRLLHDRQLLESLRGAPTADDALRAVAEAERRHA